MRLVAITLLILLTGCGSNAQLTRIERVVTPIPQELLVIPDPVPPLSPDAARNDDKAVAKWLLDSEERTLALEAKLRAIRELYRKFVEEQRKP